MAVQSITDWRENPTNLIDLYKFYTAQMDKSTGRIWKIIYAIIGIITSLFITVFQLAITVLSPETTQLNDNVKIIYQEMSIILLYLVLWIALFGYIFMRGECSRWLRYVVLLTKIESMLGMSDEFRTSVFPKDKSFLSSSYYQSVISEEINKNHPRMLYSKMYQRSVDFIKQEFSYFPNWQIKKSLSKSRRFLYFGLIFIFINFITLFQIYQWAISFSLNINQQILIAFSCSIPILIGIISERQWRKMIVEQG